MANVRVKDQRGVIIYLHHVACVDWHSGAAGVGDGGSRGAHRRGVIGHDVASMNSWTMNNTCAGLVYIDI